jgi:hypothetical protein
LRLWDAADAATATALCAAAPASKDAHQAEKSAAPPAPAASRQQPAALAEPRAPAIGRYLPYLPPVHNTTQYPISLARCAPWLSTRRGGGPGCRVQVKRQALPLPSPPPCRLQPRQPSGLVRSGQWARCYTLIRRPFHSFLNPSSLFPFPRQLLDPRPAPPPPSASPASHCLSLPFAAA